MHTLTFKWQAYRYLVVYQRAGPEVERSGRCESTGGWPRRLQYSTIVCQYICMSIQYACDNNNLIYIQYIQVYTHSSLSGKRIATQQYTRGPDRRLSAQVDVRAQEAGQGVYSIHTYTQCQYMSGIIYFTYTLSTYTLQYNTVHHTLVYMNSILSTLRLILSYHAVGLYIYITLTVSRSLQHCSAAAERAGKACRVKLLIYTS